MTLMPPAAKPGAEAIRGFRIAPALPHYARETSCVCTTWRCSRCLRQPYGVSPRGLNTDCAKRLDEPRYQGRDAQRDDHVPNDHVHRDVDAAHHLRVVARQPRDGERQKASDRTRPADGCGDMDDQRELAQRGRHDHRCGIPWFLIPPMPPPAR